MFYERRPELVALKKRAKRYKQFSAFIFHVARACFTRDHFFVRYKKRTFSRDFFDFYVKYST